MESHVETAWYVYMYNAEKWKGTRQAFSIKYRKKKGNIKFAIYMVLKILRISNPISNCKSVALSMLTWSIAYNAWYVITVF